jgi:hypothetical protein
MHIINGISYLTGVDLVVMLLGEHLAHGDVNGDHNDGDAHRIAQHHRQQFESRKRRHRQTKNIKRVPKSKYKIRFSYAFEVVDFENQSNFCQFA